MEFFILGFLYKIKINIMDQINFSEWYYKLSYSWCMFVGKMLYSELLLFFLPGPGSRGVTGGVSSEEIVILIS